MSALACIVLGLGLGLGLLFLVSAVANWDWYKGVVDFAAVEGLLGEDAARWVCGDLGLALTGYGAVWLNRGAKPAEPVAAPDRGLFGQPGSAAHPGRGC